MEMKQNTNDLPKLPDATLAEHWHTKRVFHAYTADQMRAYGELCRATREGDGEGPTIVQALELASIICDSIPTRIHEVGEGWQKRLGELVNLQPDGSHGYTVIHHALAAARRGVLGEVTPWLEYNAREAENVHLILDDEGIPRVDEAGAVYSLWGRIQQSRTLSRVAVQEGE